MALPRGRLQLEPLQRLKALGVGEHLHVRSAAPLDDCELRADVEAIRNAERHMNQQHIVRLRAAGKNLRQPGSRSCIQSQGFAKAAGKLHCTAFDCIARGVILGASMEQVDVLVKLHERIKKRKGPLE